VSALFRNLIHFGRLLRSAGVDIQAGRMIEVATALDYIDVGRRADFYHALRTLLVHRPQDLPVFDEAFRAFWRGPQRAPDVEFRQRGRRRSLGQPEVIVSGRSPGAGPDEPPTAEPVRATRVAELSYSSREVLRTKDFAELTGEEIRRAKTIIASLQWDLGSRRSWRRRRSCGKEPDLRRLARENIRYGAEPLRVPMRGRVTRPRPLVIIADVSGSMERYARMLLHFVYAVAGESRRVEAFVFATRFTRITRELAVARPRVAARIPARVPDWGGGTRIGEAVRTFNVRWARRVLSQGAIVLLISDGWDRGEPDVLAREMARLQRSCRRLIWLNPLLGTPEYRPMTRGMQAALPFVDDFLPAHNIDSLDALAAHLNRLTSGRAVRR
jgi:uncharacterized protein with von Willebrand factor type A (vWA) domain